MKYIMALDQGTTSSRTLIFDQAGTIRAVAQKEFQQIFPQPGWVEHDPAEIWQSQSATAIEALDRAGLKASDIAALGITNQRETTIIWDRATGEPIHNAIVWQDRRTAPMIEKLKADGLAGMVTSKTGLVPDAYFSASKIAWLLENVPGARSKADAGQLAFGTVDSWLVYRLSNRRLHITDSSNASRTMLFNIHTLDWDDELLALWKIPRSLLPKVRATSEVYGETEGVPGLDGISIGGMAGDQQAALFGQLCLTPGMAKNTYGTGCFLLMHSGNKPVTSKNNLLSTVAWTIQGKTEFAQEGSVFIGGAVVQWLRDGLGLIKSSKEIEALAKSVPDNGGVYFVPAFAGLGAPHWDQFARGTICGITRGTTAGHIARAAVESIAFQVGDVLDAMNADCGLDLKQLRVDGGAAGNDALLHLQADLLQIPVIRPKVLETTGLGAAYLAGLATGFWRNTGELQAQWQVEREFQPRISRDEANDLKAHWGKAVSRARG
jgi:glycerol kinase